ncbi:MAG: hypothetical protein B9S32_00375 [Verrucomicrobia bacterium Tous-C9LFEB]|nr:MAG: hypothetical protein B9S32_00375 [Verrucomicrobia bacterium Tous-C9LFEB]
MLQARFLRIFSLLLVLSGSFSTLTAQESSPSLPVIEIKAGAATIRAEVARTPEEKALGLMHRTRMPDNAGMIFILDGKSRASFWMKDTSLPLSIAFLDAQGTILQIVDLQPFDQTAVRSESDRVAFALEMNQHWFSLNRVKAGERLILVGSNWTALAKPVR